MITRYYSLLTLFLAVFILSSCSDTRDIGKVQIKGQNDLFFHITQDSEIDVVSGVDYKLISKSGEVILPKTFLFGSHDYINDTSSFKAFSFDSIVYLIFNNHNEVYAMYNLKSGKGYPRSLNDDNMDYTTKSKIAQ